MTEQELMPHFNREVSLTLDTGATLEGTFVGGVEAAFVGARYAIRTPGQSANEAGRLTAIHYAEQIVSITDLDFETPD